MTSLDLTIEPWVEGLWPVLKQTLMKFNDPVEDLSISVQQIQITTEVKPVIERALSSSNKFKTDQENVTYSPTLADLSALTLPPKPMHSLLVNLLEPSEVKFLLVESNIFSI